MSAHMHIELEIRNLLQKKSSEKQVLQQLLPRLFQTTTTEGERRAIFAFAWSSGHFNTLLEQVPELLRLNKNVSWPWLVELYARTTLAPDNETAEALLKGARAQNSVADLVSSEAWDKFVPSIKKLRREVHQLREEQHRSQRQKLLDKLVFFRNERMVEEEKRLLILMRKLYPYDSQVQALENEFSERWARHVINRHVNREDLAAHTMTPPPDDSSLAPAFREWLELTTRRPEQVYEFAVALLMMNLDVWALEVLGRGGKLDVASDWLKAELLLRSGRHIECLEQISQMEGRYGLDPETPFAATYMRAQALWGLGQKSQAVELMQTLAAVRPTYRSATSLLKDWGAV